MSIKTNPGNYFEDFRLGQTIRHATPRTVTVGDVALYTALYGSRFAVQSSDAFAKAGAEVAVTMGMMVLITGPLWAAKAWGRYWTWDPRLTTSMLSVLVYVAYVVLRAFTGDGEAERKFAAALGVLGAANLPIIHYSVQKWGGQHPKVISTGGGGLRHPDMKLALTLGFVTFTLLAITLVWHRTRLHLLAGRVDDLEQEAIELGLAGDG